MTQSQAIGGKGLSYRHSTTVNPYIQHKLKNHINTTFREKDTLSKKKEKEVLSSDRNHYRGISNNSSMFLRNVGDSIKVKKSSLVTGFDHHKSITAGLKSSTSNRNKRNDIHQQLTERSDHAT